MRTSISEQALESVRDGMTLGLGTGKAATAFVQALGARVAAGLSVRGVPTSEETASLARKLEIPLVTLEEAGVLDLTVDGADEVSPSLDLVKGWGGALVREKIVAASSRRLVILVGSEKLVDRLGQRGKLPVEVVPFAMPLVARRLGALGISAAPRLRGEQPMVTDNGNHILDCAVKPIADPAQLERELRDIPGVVGTGLFLGMADTVLVQREDTVEVCSRGGAEARNAAA